jgi:hypothetical protein
VSNFNRSFSFSFPIVPTSPPSSLPSLCRPEIREDFVSLQNRRRLMTGGCHASGAARRSRPKKGSVGSSRSNTRPCRSMRWLP